jgi:hypothetical protein
MPTPDEAARRRRINRILLPIVGAIVLVVIVAAVLVKVSEKRTEDERVQETITSAAPPDMTDEEYQTFREKAVAIDPDLAEGYLRNDARDSCASINGDNAAKNVAARFSRQGNTVSKDEAEQIVELIRDIGFCDR